MTPRGHDLESAKGGPLAARGPATVRFARVQEAGFDIVPSVVRNHLFATRAIGSAAISASAQELAVRRRSTGSHYQSGDAWWGDDDRAIVFTVRREMAHRGGRSYSPNGPWLVIGTRYQLGQVGGPERSTWQYDSSTTTGSGHARPTTTSDPLDLLPPDVTAPIRGGLSDVWREISTEQATEYLTAIRARDNCVLLLEAHRTASSIAALSSAAWQLTTLDAPIIASTPISFTCSDDGLPPRTLSEHGG